MTVIRTFSPADLPKLLLIEQEVHLNPWTESSFQPCISGRYLCWVAERDNTICGYAIVQQLGPEAELLNIAVALSAQQQGVGRALLQTLNQHLRSTHSEQCFLEVRESNQGAIALYESEGFGQIGMRNDYYPKPGGGREDALIYGLMLSDPFNQ